MVRTTVPNTALALAKSDSFVWLIRVAYTELSTGNKDYIRVCSNPVSLTFEGDLDSSPSTYEAAPFVIEPLKETHDASDYAEWKLSISDVGGLVKSWMRENETLVGRRATLYLVQVLKGATAAVTGEIFRQQFIVKGVALAQDSVQWNMGTRNFLNLTFPGRRVFRSRCGHIFRGPRCGYDQGALGAGSGGVQTCDYTLNGENGCVSKANQDRYGGFTHIPFGTDR